MILKATAFADLRDFRHFDRSFGQTNRLRARGARVGQHHSESARSSRNIAP